MALVYDARTGTLTSNTSYSLDLTVGNITFNTANNIDFEDGGTLIGRWRAEDFNVYSTLSGHTAPGLADSVTHNWSGGNYFTTFSGGPTWTINGTTGITISDPVTFSAADATNTSINIPHGAAPTTPTDGDVWTTTAGLFVQANGTTAGPLVDVAGVPASPSADNVFKWTYSSNTTMADPGAGFIRFSNATPTSSVRMAIHYTDADGNSVGPHILDAWGGAVFGTLIRMTKVGDPTTYMVWALNSDTDLTSYNVPYINMIAWEGTWTNGDEIYVEIQTQPYVTRPATDNGIYVGVASLSGQPTCGLRQSTNVTSDPDLASANLNIGALSTTATGTAITMSGAGIWRRNASTRHEWYGATNVLPRLTVTEASITVGHQNDTGNGAPSIYMHERDSAGGSTADFGQIWVDRVAPNVLMFTDDAGTDWNISDPGATSTTITAGWSTGSGGSFTVAANTGLFLSEQANDDTPGAGQGQVWVQTDTPNRLMFTDDTGQDFRVTPYRATVTTDTVNTIAAQDETSYDNSPTSEGTFVGGDGAGGTAYVVSDTITLSDGSVITVDAIDGNGDVTQFTVTTGSTTPFTLGGTLTQSSTSGTGTGFTLTPDTDNVTSATQEIISIPVASGTTFGYRINIVGNEAATGDTVFESIFGAIHNQAGTTAIVGSDIVDRTEDAGAAAWAVTVAADDTTDALTVDVTGEVAHTINWKVSVEILDV